MADSGESIPQGLDFLGYDACYTPDSDGFSAICDCMFLCRWHGCDETGMAFADDFGRLNTHGLFRSKRETEDYLCRYLMQECLTEREADVIRRRYGLEGRAPQTQRQVAAVYGISRSYVSRIEKRALEKLEQALRERGV